MKALYLIDGVFFLFRSYYAIRGMTDPRGRSTGALYGFIRSVQKIIKEFEPEYLLAIFDGPNNKQKRTAIYEAYKSHRAGMPDDLADQLEWSHTFCSAAGIPYLSEEGVEADDLIGAIAQWAAEKGARVFICSSDKDLCQLVNDQIVLINPFKENLVIDRNKVRELYGVWPEQIVDYLAIMGDSSDNIPGIPGLGPKTASALLEEYGTLEGVLSHASAMSNKKRGEKIQQHEEKARISQQLATLIPIDTFPQESAFYKLKTPKWEALTALYREMQFNSLLKEMEATSPRQEEVKTRYHIVDEEVEVEALFERLRQEKMIGIDVESDRLSPMEAQLVGIGFAIEPGEAWYLPANGKLGSERALALLRPFLEDPSLSFYGHNIKYDLHILKNHGIEVRQIGFDTMIASHLCAPQENRHGLDHLTLEKFGKVKTPIKTLIGSGKQERSMAEVAVSEVGPYCCEDVDYSCRLKKLYERELEEKGLRTLFDSIELPLIPILMGMEREGIYVDKRQLKELATLFEGTLSQLERGIYELAGCTFNIKSPKQLGEVLFDTLKLGKGIKKRSTRADILEELKTEHPIAEKLLEFRALEKLRSTYATALPLQINPKSGRIHCTFMQTVTATGRLSCQDPNLQNIPIRSEEGRKIRRAFMPEQEGRSYLSADYSQIELRLLAHLSQDPKMVAAFQEGRDIHRSLAAKLFDLPQEEVSQEMRHVAKTVNFGIIYGQQAYSLSQDLKCDKKKAALFIEKYFQEYKGVAHFIEEQKERVRASGQSETLFGRKRPIPEINSKNGMIRALGERLAINTPLQGSQADIIKKAMITIAKQLKKNPLGKMILQIHDELIFELPDSHILEMEEQVQAAMEGVVTLSIPLVVNIHVGKNWGAW